MKNLVTQDIQGNPFNGGMRFDWDDLTFVQGALKEALQNVNKAIGNQTPLYVISGCTHQYLYQSGGSGSSGLSLEISEGIVSVNGEPMGLDAFSNHFSAPAPSYVGIPPRFWFEIFGGTKTTLQTSETFQIYTENKLRINWGDVYPEGIENVDYFPIPKTNTTNGVRIINTMYQILQNNLQKPTEQASVVSLFGGGNVYFRKSGNVVSVCANLTMPQNGTIAPGAEICTVPSGFGNPLTNSYQSKHLAVTSGDHTFGVFMVEHIGAKIRGWHHPISYSAGITISFAYTYII